MYTLNKSNIFSKCIYVNDMSATDTNAIKGSDSSFRRLMSMIAYTVVISSVYFAVSRLSLLLAVGNSNASPVWPPSGIALAAVLIWGYRISPAVFIGAFIANILSLKGITASPYHYILASLGTAAGNMMEGIIGAYLVRRFSGEGSSFDNIRNLFVFIFFGCIVNTTVSATTGVACFCSLTGDWSMTGSFWVTWWLGDVAGIITVAPVILMIRNKIPLQPGRRMRIEAILIFTLLALATASIFLSGVRLEYLVIPPLIWISLRFGRIEAAVAVMIVSAVTIICAIHGADAVSSVSLNRSLLYIQSYIGVIAIMTLCLSVLIHERRQAERSRTAALKQMYDIIEFLPDATFAVNRRGEIIAWNRALETLTGIHKNAMIGRKDHVYGIPFYGKPQPMMIDHVIEPIDPELLRSYDVINLRGNSVTAESYNAILDRHLAIAASVLVDADGAIDGAIESIRDISDRKIAELNLAHHREHLEEIVQSRSSSLIQANERLKQEIEERDRISIALSESERKYRDLVESANCVILRWTTDGTITFFNSFAQKFFEYEEAEIIGKNVIGTIVRKQESSSERDLASLIEDIMAHPESHVFNENENVKKNNEAVWIAWTNKPISDRDGNVTEILSVGIDITARKKIEESLRQTLNDLAVAKEQAEAADRIKSAFLATMSHELRTPLNSIIGFTGIIIKGLAGPLNGEQTKQMNMVMGSARHLLSLINDVLDISKIEAGQFEVYAEPFNVLETVTKVIETIKPIADKKGLSLVVDQKTEVGVAVADQRRVEQILLNLLSNAIKFTERGDVKIEISVIEDYRRSDNTPPHPAVHFAVTDTGIGVRSEDLKTLFQPFRQIDTGLARKNEGTGLGLAICRRLADLMGGEILAESEWGRGSTFTFILPIRGHQ
jgi:PAS domain S-box-containing protein